MKLHKLILAAFFATLAPSAFAQTAGFSEEQAVSYCIAETNAPGTYVITTRDPAPTVAASAPAFASGTARVNDCLQDVYAVQYGYAAVSGGAISPRAVAEAECRRIRNRRIISSVAAVVGLAAGLGDSLNAGGVIGGAVGIGAVTVRSNRSYRQCMANAQLPETQRRLASLCSRGDVFIGGTGYCRRF